MLNTFMWPSVVAILGIATLLILRQAWIGLIGRISRISPTGASFERPERMQEGRNPQGALSFQDLMKIPISASVLQREEIIKQQFHGLNLKNDVEKMEILVRAFAMSRIEMEFNNISNFIFGSQVTLLVQLSSVMSHK